jgi:hypothetical protein
MRGKRMMKVAVAIKVIGVEVMMLSFHWQWRL